MKLSVSSVRTWSTCRLAWWFRYVARAVPAHHEAEHLTLGTALHAGLAAAYEAASQVAAPPRGARMDSYIDVALNALEAALPGETSPQARAEVVGLLVMALESLPALPGAVILGAEVPFSFPASAGEVRGSIDLAFRTGATSLHIRDWKWSSTPDADSMQTAIYLIAARRLWPWARRITVGYYSVKRLEEHPAELTDATANLRLDQLTHEGNLMKEARNDAATGTPAIEAYAPTPGQHCGSCPFRAYCPAYAGPLPPLTYPAEDVASTRGDLLRRLNK